MTTVRRQDWQWPRPVALNRVDECARLRASGDWRGLLRLTGVSHAIDLTEVARRFDSVRARRIEDDLIGFDPDMLRWHLTHHDGIGALLVLSTLPRLSARAPVLLVDLAEAGAPGVFRLRVGTPPQPASRRVTWDLPPSLWHASEVGGLAELFGAPDHHADDSAALTAGDVESIREGTGLLAPARGLVGEVRRLTHRYGVNTAILAPVVYGCRGSIVISLRAGRPIITDGRQAGSNDRVPIAPPAYATPPELASRGEGSTPPPISHRLIHGVLRPGQHWSPAPLPAVTFTSTRVRCGGVWHEVVISDGALRMPHDPVELRRERTVGALGGVVNGCAAVETSWHDGPGWLPKVLRVQRRDFFGHARRGDTDMIVHLLDNGFDPLVRDRTGRTLLHYLPALDHTRLLPRLSELGLSLDVEDVGGNTPLSTARHQGADDLVEVLMAHGAADSRATIPQCIRG